MMKGDKRDDNIVTDSNDEQTNSKKNLVVHPDEVAFVKKSTTTATAIITTTAVDEHDPNNVHNHNMSTMEQNIKDHMDNVMAQMRGENKRDFENLLSVIQQESIKQRSQLLLQNEYMVAMELKLLRLEAKVERREQQQQTSRNLRQQQQPRMQQQHHLHQTNYNQHQQTNSNNNSRFPTTFTTINESSLERNPRSPSSSSVRRRNSREEEDDDEGGSSAGGTPPNMASVNISSGASLASGVTAGSFLVDDVDDDDHDDEEEKEEADMDEEDGRRRYAINNNCNEDEDGDHDSESRSDSVVSESGYPVIREVDLTSQQSTPTLGSRNRVAVGENGTVSNLESILLNPMIGELSSMQALSVRATRGRPELDNTDGNSSLATSVTNSTYTSTVVTSTTRGDQSTINVRMVLPEEEEQLQMDMDVNTPSRRGRSSVVEDIPREEPRSRSQSPLTVNTHASDTLSLASASTVGTSIRSSVAVAPRAVFGGRNSNSINTANNNNSGRVISTPANNTNANMATTQSLDSSRPLADRVVSFTPDLTNLPPAPQYNNSVIETADSITTTMPDDLDNFSAEEVADTFARSARVWREEYEARLDALHKRWSNDE